MNTEGPEPAYVCLTADGWARLQAQIRGLGAEVAALKAAQTVVTATVVETPASPSSNGTVG